MTQTGNELNDDLWLLQSDEMSLLPGTTEIGRLGFTQQLKFRQVNGRYPERPDETGPQFVEALAKQIGVGAATLSTYDLDSRQSQRHRQVIRRILGYQLSTVPDLLRLREWLASDVLPFDPRARHAGELALDWFKAQRLEPPALGELDRAIRSAVHGFESQLLEAIHLRLSAARKAAIDRLLAGAESDGNADSGSATSTSTFTQLKADIGRASRDNLLLDIERPNHRCYRSSIGRVQGRTGQVHRPVPPALRHRIDP
jgi:hypothetical protein